MTEPPPLGPTTWTRWDSFLEINKRLFWPLFPLHFLLLFWALEWLAHFIWRHL